MDDQPKNSREKRLLDNKAGVLLIHLFNKFCTDEKVAPRKRGDVLLAYFCGWLNHNMPEMDATAVCAAAKVDFEVWEFVREVIDGGLGPERLSGSWPYICLAHVPPPKNPVASVTMLACITYEDGKVCPIVSKIDKLLTEHQLIFDAMAGEFILTQSRELYNLLVDNTLDGLHDVRAEDLGGEEAFNVFMGSWLKILPHISEQYRGACERQMRLYQLFFTREAARRQVAERLKAQQAKQEQSKPGRIIKPPQGGWSD